MRPPADDDSWALLRTCSNELGAELLAHVLGQAGIAHEIRADPAWLGAGRFCRVLVPSSLKARAEMVARALMAQDAIKTVMDVSSPETALDVIQWYTASARRCGD